MSCSTALGLGGTKAGCTGLGWAGLGWAGDYSARGEMWGGDGDGDGDGMGWDGMGWDGMGWDGMGWGDWAGLGRAGGGGVCGIRLGMNAGLGMDGWMGDGEVAW